MPLPQILQTMMMAIAERATHQEAWQLLIAEPERVRPIAMIIGPVTIGGKNLITFLTPNALIRAARMKYMSPAKNTPMQA